VEVDPWDESRALSESLEQLLSPFPVLGKLQPSNDCVLANNYWDSQSESAPLSWSASLSGFVLESSDAVPASTWAAVSPAPIVEAGQNVVMVEAGGSAKFFRLRKP